MPVTLVRTPLELRGLLRRDTSDHFVITKEFEVYHGSVNPNLTIIQRDIPTHLIDKKLPALEHALKLPGSMPMLFTMGIKAGTILIEVTDQVMAATMLFTEMSGTMADGIVDIDHYGLHFRIQNASQLRIIRSQIATPELLVALHQEELRTDNQ